MKVKSESKVAQSCPTLCDPMDCSPPGSSVHGIFQARVLEWVATAFSDDRFDEIGNRITALKGTSQAKWEENELEIFALNKLANVSKASYSEMRS